MSQIFGVAFTLLMGDFLRRFGPFWALSLIVACLSVGALITLFIPNKLLRQEALGVVPESEAFLSMKAKRKDENEAI